MSNGCESWVRVFLMCFKLLFIKVLIMVNVITMMGAKPVPVPKTPIRKQTNPNPFNVTHSRQAEL